MGTEFSAHVTDTQLRAWVLKGRSVRVIAVLMGTTVDEVKRRVLALWRQAEEKAHYQPPDEETIRQRCLEIQASWSDEERLRRAGIRSRAVEATVVPASDLAPQRRGWR